MILKKTFLPAAFIIFIFSALFLSLNNTQAQPFDYCKFENKEGAQCPASGYAGNQSPYDAKNCSGTAAANQVCCCTKKPESGENALPPGPKEVIPPVLSVSIPGFGNFSKVSCDETSETCQIPWLAEYIGALYKYSLVIIGLLAVIVMMIGGVRWLTAGGAREAISDAMNWIKGGLLGIILAVCSYLLLFIINPDLTILQPLNISYIDRRDLDILDSPDAGNSSGLPPGQSDPQCLQTGGINDLNKIAQVYDNDKVTYRYGAIGGDCTVQESGKECKCPAGQLCFDCSNFIRHILSCVGKTGPSGTTSDIFANAEEIKTATSTTVNGKNINPGDLLGWPKKSSGGNTGHVVLYIGNGQIVESHGGSGRKGDSVDISSWEDYYNKYKNKKPLHINRGS